MTEVVTVVDKTIHWIVLCAIFAVVMVVEHRVEVLTTRISQVEEDLNLGDPVSTTSFRRATMTMLQSIQEQVRLNASMLKDLDAKLGYACSCDTGAAEGDD